MTTYCIVAMNADGQEVRDEILAETVDIAIAKIRSQGHFPTSIKIKSADAPAPAIPQDHVYWYGPWHTYDCCVACQKEVLDATDDVCPFCGAQPDPNDEENFGVFFKTATRIRRWAQTSPWWRFWSVTGYWEYKKDDYKI